MALSVSCTCCALVIASAVCCGYLCYPSAGMRQWPLWSNPVPLSLFWCTRVVPLFLRCYIICHMVLIAQCGKVLRLPLRSYRLDNRISQFRFDSHYISPSSEPVQSTHDRFISVASPNSGLPRKLHVDFGKRSLKNIGGHRHIYILFFSTYIIPRPRIAILNINRGYHQVWVAKNHCTGHQRRVSTQSADQRSRIWIVNP